MKVKDILKLLEGANPDASVIVKCSIDCHRSTSYADDADLSITVSPENDAVIIAASGEETDYD